MRAVLADLTNSGAIPALEAVMRFSGARQRLIASNIANIDTPGYQPMDVSVDGFRGVLRDAIHRRREQNGGSEGALLPQSTRELAFDSRGGLRLSPTTPSGNILFHDRNNRDLERMSQSLVENATAYKVAADLLRTRYSLLQSAIAERV